MGAAVPARVVLPDESDVRLVDQGGRLEGLAGRLAREPPSRQQAQLAVDQWQELLGCPGSPCSTSERIWVGHS